MSQKLDNQLNLALDATEEERRQSRTLDIGYISQEKEWELIVRYSGSSEQAKELAVSFDELTGGYAIVRIGESQIEKLAGLSEMEYIEKPKRLYFQVQDGRRVSCIDAVQDNRLFLRGKDVLIGILDSGIDFVNADFRKEDGRTRIISIWDQTLKARDGEKPPEGYSRGVEYTEEELNQALQAKTPEERLQLVRTTYVSGHGTAVAGVAAGNGRNSSGRYAGVAPESLLIIVKLGTPEQDGFPRTTELMLGLDYLIKKAIELQKPIAVNMSFGNTYGSHDGTSLVERFIDNMSNVWKNVICIGTGNEAAGAGHTSGKLIEGKEERIELAIQERQPALNVQIWKEYTDEMEISLITPSGIQSFPLVEKLGTQRITLGQTELLIYYGKPSPYSTAQEIYIEFLPVNQYVGSGVWKLILNPKKIVNGSYEMWLPSGQTLNAGTSFLKPKAATTLTIPSTASRVISVGAYDARTFSYADFSGRGPLRGGGGFIQKPDLVAPGVNVTTVAAGGGYAMFTGTSFATPFTTGAAALLMEWGIVRGNDPYLYGEKVKAYLRRGARAMPGYSEYPNAEVGYGALCTAGSIPK